MRIFFCSDLHASEKCWLKFLRAGTFYGADVIMVGGDITGKFVIPIVRVGSSTWTTKYMGKTTTLTSAAEVEDLKRRVSYAGSYPTEMTEDEFAAYDGNQAAIDSLFQTLVADQIHRWIGLADARLAGSSVRCFVQGANDDYLVVDDYLRASKRIEVPEGRVLDLAEYELLSVGYGNPTPWNCPRDISEEELTVRIDTLATSVRNMSRAIFNLHVPPVGSQLDLAPRLDEELRMVLSSSGAPEMVPVGSTAVRDAILRYQPMIGLHGHIHESKGIRKLGSTVIANPGSEYQEGILNGLLVELDPGKGVVRSQLVSG